MLALCQNQWCSQEFLMSLECITSFVIPGSLSHAEPKITLDLAGWLANHVSKQVLYSCLKHVSFNCLLHISYSRAHLNNCNAHNQSSCLSRLLWPMQLFPHMTFDSGLLILQFLKNTSKVGEKKKKKKEKGKEGHCHILLRNVLSIANGLTAYTANQILLAACCFLWPCFCGKTKEEQHFCQLQKSI